MAKAILRKVEFRKIPETDRALIEAELNRHAPGEDEARSGWIFDKYGEVYWVDRQHWNWGQGFKDAGEVVGYIGKYYEQNGDKTPIKKPNA
ncbi:MAG: hypothetical protein HYS81_01435 [Candidatus Aenigmatarchaeota archaeon]|nr:MAG: hypothetical protein HYS81_01435 [Candidatus Aenigmarchaeota archaeon]